LLDSGRQPAGVSPFESLVFSAGFLLSLDFHALKIIADETRVWLSFFVGLADAFFL